MFPNQTVRLTIVHVQMVRKIATFWYNWKTRVLLKILQDWKLSKPFDFPIVWQLMIHCPGLERKISMIVIVDVERRTTVSDFYC